MANDSCISAVARYVLDVSSLDLARAIAQIKIDSKKRKFLVMALKHYFSSPLSSHALVRSIPEARAYLLNVGKLADDIVTELLEPEIVQ